MIEKERAGKMFKWLGKGYGKEDGMGVTHKMLMVSW